MSNDFPLHREDFFYEVFKKHDMVMLLIDPVSGRILDANLAAEKYYGYSLEQFHRLNISEINQLPPEQVAQMRDHVLRQERTSFVFPHKLGDGQVRDVEVNSSPIQLHGKTILFSIIQDVTERIQMEAALRASEERYRSLFDRIIDGFYRSTHDGRFVEVNPALVRMFGYASKEEMLNLDIKNELYFSPEERGSHILDTGKEEIEVYRMRRKDGSEIWVEDHGYYVHDELGNILFHEGVLRDVTGRIQAEQAYHESKDLLKESQTIAGIGSYVLDFSNGLWQSSNVLDRIFGIDETYERSIEGWGNLIHPDEQGEMLRYLHDEVAGNRTRFDKEYKIVRYNDKTERWVHGLGELELDPQGRLVKMKGTIQDITDRKKMEASLRNRLVELETLFEVSASLRAVQTFEEALPILLEKTLAALETDTGSILLYQPETNDLRSVIDQGWFLDLQNVHLKVGEGIAGKVFESGEVYISHEFVKDSNSYIRSREKVPTGWGGICIPIRSIAEVVGVLFIAVKLPRQTTPEQVKLLQSLAEIAGATIHRSRLYDETARRAEEFASLYETSQALSEQVELKPLLFSIVKAAKRLLNSASSGMYMFDPSANELILAMDTEPYIPTGTRLKVGEGAAGYVAQTRQPLRIEDYSTWAGRSIKYNGIPLRAVLEVPMLYGGELIGVLVVDEAGDSQRTYTEADERLLSLFASQAAGAIHSTRLREEALHRLHNLQSLYEVDKVIASSLDLRITLNLLLNHVVNQLHIDAADVLLLHPFDQTLQFSAARGFRTNYIETAEVHLNDRFAGRCVMERRTIKIFDSAAILDNPPFVRLWQDEEFENYICFPLIVKGEVKGVLEVYGRSKFSATDEWFEFLETLANQAAITIDNTQMFDNLQRVNMELAVAYEATIEGWSRALDMRYKEIEGHTLRATELSLLLARALGVRDNQLQHIRHGALLHDIGKMGISDHILLKKSKLTEKEWTEMRKHPALAYQLLNPIHYLRPALDIPHCHHEKWDGTGYPRGLKGEQIPFAARIFAVADVWDALNSPRPYRKAWTKKRAIAYIKQQSGLHFDPRVVEAFLKLLTGKDN